jgi:hypothetical protein
MGLVGSDGKAGPGWGVQSQMSRSTCSRGPRAVSVPGQSPADAARTAQQGQGGTCRMLGHERTASAAGAWLHRASGARAAVLAGAIKRPDRSMG